MTRLRFGICPTEGGRFFGEALAEVERAEELGFDSVWLAEHHGVPDHYWPAPVQVLTALAARTSRVVLGANVCVFPFYHPVRLAEETALLDVVSNGRAVLGVAIGYKPDEFLLYNAALEKRGARLEEGLALMKALWTRDGVTHRGGHFTVVDGRIEPKPVQRPHPPDRRLGRRHAPAGGAARGCVAARAHRRPVAAPPEPGPDPRAPARRGTAGAGRVAAHAGARRCRDGAGGARARRPAPQARVRQGVRRDVEAPVHRRRDGR